MTDGERNTATLLKHACQIFRSNLSSLVGFAVLPVAFLFPAVFFVVANGARDVRSAWESMSWVHKLIFVAGYIAFFLMAVRSIAATVHLASESYVNRKIGMRQAYGRVRRRNLGVVWLRFILFFFVPALFLAPVITFIVGPGIPVAVLEDLNLRSGPVSRGWSLSQGKKGRVALLFLLSWMASAIVFAGWRVVVNLELLPFYPAGNMASSLLLFIVLFVVEELWIIGLTLHYYDCKGTVSTPQTAM